jgi:ubiquitin carboxyl-terminal hydrolase 7
MNEYSICKSSDNVYYLHSVIVHSGEIDHGHYYSYLKPEINSKWYKFDDKNVSIVNECEVFDMNYGGDRKSYKVDEEGKVFETNVSNISSAYLLLYIKKSYRADILCKVKGDEVLNFYIDIRKYVEHSKER